MKKKDEIVVVTMRCIDMAASRSDVDKIRCAECGEMTWLSISWRGKKIDRIICESCFKNRKYKNSDYSACVTEECLEEAVESVRDNYGETTPDKDIKKRMIKIVEEKLGKKVKIIK
jgi:hypothetical protein